MQSLKVTWQIAVWFLAGGLALNLVVQAQSNSLPPETSRAAQEAEQRVSLSAIAITEILRQEPGLLLAVKKALVREAYEQGRLLDPAQLTDEALFQLLQEDNNIRILATREIEDRRYVRVKPTARELQQDELRRNLQHNRRYADQHEAAGQEEKQEETSNQEDRYWSSQQPPMNRRPEAQPQTPDELDGFPPEPTPQLELDPRRIPDLAGTEPLSPDSTQVIADQAGSLQSLSPSELPEMLRASEKEDSRYPTAGPYLEASDGRTIETLSSESRSSGFDSQNANFGGRIPRHERNAQQPPGENEDRAPIRRQPNPYADVPSLYDLYQQVSKRPTVTRRFGLDVFQNGTGNFDRLPMDVPVGPDYVLGPGDGLNIAVWGSVTERLQRLVDRQGMVTLPEAGGVQVAGKSLAEVQRLVQAALRTQYRDAQADVSLARLRDVRVYVVGDVVRPGAYDVSALSTPFNALYLAGGPTARGSMRVLHHYRGNQLLEAIDVYDLLLHGVRQGGHGLQSGDTIQVPPLGPEVTVEGMVRRPAIYELNGESTLAEILQMAGGVLTSGTLRHIEVERVVAHQSRTMLRIDLPEENTEEKPIRRWRRSRCRMEIRFTFRRSCPTARRRSTSMATSSIPASTLTGKECG